jgi:hypothetical protein
MNRRLLLAGGAAAGITSITAALLLGPDEPPAGAGPAGLMFPGLAARLADAHELRVRSHDGQLLLRRTPGGWVLPERDGFPVRESRLRELLTGFTELRLVEPRATDAEGWARLGVDDPETPGSTALLLRLTDSQGRVIMEAITGRRRVRTQGNVPETVFVRRPNESQAWLAEGRVGADADPSGWMDRDIVHLPAERIQRVMVRRAGEAPLGLGRAAPGQPLLVTLPPDPPQMDNVALEDVARAFEHLTLMDAVSADRVPGVALGEARFELDRGLNITVWANRMEQFLWVRMQAEGGTEALALSARWRPWAYQVGVWKERAFAPRLEELTGAR